MTPERRKFTTRQVVVLAFAAGVVFGLALAVAVLLALRLTGT